MVRSLLYYDYTVVDQLYGHKSVELRNEKIIFFIILRRNVIIYSEV